MNEAEDIKDEGAMGIGGGSFNEADED